MINDTFLSNFHTRFQNGQIIKATSSDSEGRNFANRLIQVKENSQNSKLIDVTISNLDENVPEQLKVSMSTKTMKLIGANNGVFEFRDFTKSWLGSEQLGDYGIVLSIDHRGITKCVLKLHDRNTELHYETGIPDEIIDKLNKGLQFYEVDDMRSAGMLFLEVYNFIVVNPGYFKKCSELAKLGQCMFILFSLQWTNDEDIQQGQASMAYYLMTKGLKSQSDVNVEKNRFFTLMYAHDVLKYSMMNTIQGVPFGSPMFQMIPVQSRDRLWILEMCIVYKNPILLEHFEDLVSRHNENLDRLQNDFFLPCKNEADILTKGQQIEEEFYSYLHNKLWINENTNFS